MLFDYVYLVRFAYRLTCSLERAEDGLNATPTARFNFDGWSSSRPAGGKPTGAGQFGYAMAGLAMGRLSAFNAGGLRDFDICGWSYYSFFQDDWRVTRMLICHIVAAQFVEQRLNRGIDQRVIAGNLVHGRTRARGIAPCP